ncbi:MAG: c-type cytochrome, partial [Candidatus Omnitrophica bacterium]|nr:c-type cytochrome [Candidatus Omnitrophota bacterium]
MGETNRAMSLRLRSIVFVGMVSLASLLSFFILAYGQLQLSIPEKPSLTKTLFARGEALYQKQCASCHGLLGAGDGKAAYLLYPKPRDFTRGEFRLISTNDMNARDEDLFKVITRGMPGSAMPPWEFLAPEDRWSLVYYVRYLIQLGKKRAKGEMTDEVIQKGLSWSQKQKLAKVEIDPEAVIKVSEEPSITQESLARGQELFVKACASCHGPQGRGDGQQIMQDGLGFPLKPRDLTAGIFKGASSSEELYYRIAAGLPGSPMPSYQAALT